MFECSNVQMFESVLHHYTYVVSYGLQVRREAVRPRGAGSAGACGGRSDSVYLRASRRRGRCPVHGLAVWLGKGYVTYRAWDPSGWGYWVVL